MKQVEVTWEGFRGFKKPTSIALPQLTLLIGRNNVGKTSAYAPLLMLRQTLDARDPNTGLLSRGSLIDAGPFRDYVSDHDTTKSILFSITVPEPPEIKLKGGTQRVARIEVGFGSPDGQTTVLTRQRIIDGEGKPLVTRTRNAGGEPFDVRSRLLPSSAPVGRPPREKTLLREAIREEQPEGFLIDGFGALIVPRQIRTDKERWTKVQDWYNAAYELFEVQHAANAAVRQLLMGLSYVGPLRSLPLRTYRLAAEAPIDVGSSGELAPEVLFRLHEDDTGSIVSDWLRRLGYGNLRFEHFGDEYFQVKFETSGGVRVNIADSGVGLSQVLPLLVQGVMADRGGTLIAQQPEIHLNPAQQSIVTDFLIDCAMRGIRVVIETHSEHVLLRLRRRIAEAAIQHSEVAVYYVDNIQGETQVRRVELGDAGEIERSDWPIGFFEDQLADSFALARAQAERAGVK